MGKSKKSVSAEYADGMKEPKSYIEVTEKKCPGIKDKQIDDEVEFTVKGKVSRISKDDWNNNIVSANIQISSITMK